MIARQKGVQHEQFSHLGIAEHLPHDSSRLDSTRLAVIWIFNLQEIVSRIGGIEFLPIRAEVRISDNLCFRDDLLHYLTSRQGFIRHLLLFILVDFSFVWPKFRPAV